MKKIEFGYNPYKMTTRMFINGIDVCKNRSYEKIENL